MVSVSSKVCIPEAAQAAGFYREAIKRLNEHDIDYLVGGAYALAHYTGIVRDTKDFDIFVRPRDCGRVLDLLAAAGYRTELTFPHWLGKAFHEDYLIDVIFSSGNGMARVDDAWFQHAEPGTAVGESVWLVPAEEMIWSKGYIMERERFDGADILHLLHARGPKLDWKRLLERYGCHWRVLLSHLTLFGFVYPAEKTKIPHWVMQKVLRRLEEDMRAPQPASRLCYGTLLSREQYLFDIRQQGYLDPRREPHGPMSAESIARWTAAISDEA
jgi:hypothetical protein